MNVSLYNITLLQVMDMKTSVGNLATVFTIGVFLSGIPVCYKIYRKRTAADVSALPFICGFISCSLWLRYGMFVHDSALMIVNSFGFIFQLFYIICYAMFLKNSQDVFAKQVLGALSSLAIIIFYTSIWLADDVPSGKYVAGLAACSAGVLFMSSPLASVFHVIKTKCSECLPSYMILFTFIMAILWVWYGVLLKDMFIQVPNFLGALTSGVQLCLLYLYPSKKNLVELPKV